MLLVWIHVEVWKRSRVRHGGIKSDTKIYSLKDKLFSTLILIGLIFDFLDNLNVNSNTTIIFCYAQLTVVPETIDGGLMSVTLLRFELSAQDRS